MIRLRVEWLNPKHALLAEAGAKISVTASGTGLTPTAQGAGFREYEIPASTTEFLLEISFAPQLSAVGAAAAMSAEVFRASQRYVISDGGNRVEAPPMPPFLQSHPLIDSKIQANSNIAILAQARTEIVDITKFWDHYIAWKPNPTEFETRIVQEFRTEREPNVQLSVLGYTGGGPLIWFASVPVILSLPKSTQISALVFYRPANYAYSKVDDRHDAYPLNRYILSAVPPGVADRWYWRSDQIVRDPLGDWYFWLPCGMEHALSASGREVLLLQPWASGLAYGDAANSNLPAVAEQIVRFLYAIQALALGGFNVSLGRLGISGYSAGGDTLWNSLSANRSRVDEVYSFDANHTGKQGSRLDKWFKASMEAGREPRLFFANGLGNNVAAGGTIASAMNRKYSPAANRILSLPKSPVEYGNGSIPYWVYATNGNAELQTDGTSLHQFPAYGRYPRVPGESMADNPTFLQMFLEMSGF